MTNHMCDQDMLAKLNTRVLLTVIKTGKILLYCYCPPLVEVVSNILLCFFFQPTEDTDNIDILPTTGMVYNNF